MSPFKKQQIKELVSSIRNKNYAERLKILGLTSQEARRRKGDLIQLFKIERNLNTFNWYHPISRTPGSMLV
jgi:hypothetical protein